MMGGFILGPLIAAALYAVVFAKAGFRGPVLAVAAAPILAALLQVGVLRPMGGAGELRYLALATLPISLLPLLCLAFMTWPSVPTGAASGKSP